MHDTTNPAPSLRAVAWTSVNRWECDENDHLNVRFDAQKMDEAIDLALADRGLGPASIASQHMRYLAEARVAAPLRIDAAPVGRDALLTAMYNVSSGAVLASFITRFRDPITVPDPPIELPDWAGPRGVTAAVPSPDHIPGAFVTIGRGVIGAHECNTTGEILPQTWVARISDGMANFWHHVNGPADAEAHAVGDQGGAVLEYRLTIHTPLSAGDRFAQRSGITAIGNRTMAITHLIVDEAHGRCAASAEIIAVSMDLATRRAAPISTERRARMERMLAAPDPSR
jgi:acyl-CoA thioester hydrolase